MASRAFRFASVLALASLTGLAGCELLQSPSAPRSSLPPERRPAAQPAPDPEPEVSARSRALRLYYTRLQADLLSQGLLRTDGGGPDTPFTADMLAANFETIALAEEYARGQGLTAGDGSLGPVKKWAGPVRVSAEFGASVRADRRADDVAELTRYVNRLARVTGHPISMSARSPNFVVLFVGEDDSATAVRRLREIVPNVDPATVALVRNLPRAVHCLVAAFSTPQNPYAYDKAVAVIRAEHPTILRRACIHEEVAQGLGLANDSPRARPSIFNDDDEFAYLTRHDELLLKILYDPRLTPGMSAEAARPIVRAIAESLVAGPS